MSARYKAVNRPEDVVLAWVKRQHRMPLTLLETSWLVGVCPRTATFAYRSALKKIRAQLTTTMYGRTK